jgi:hypothetical protein
MSIFDRFPNNKSKDWPNDADGDVLRRMKESDFDFSKVQLIDFNVDLKSWPPKQELVDVLIKQYGDIKGYPPSDDFNGYLQFQVKDKVTYELVMRVQEEVTNLTAAYGGICESWGVMQD